MPRRSGPGLAIVAALTTTHGDANATNHPRRRLTRITPHTAAAPFHGSFRGSRYQIQRDLDREHDTSDQ